MDAFSTRIAREHIRRYFLSKRLARYVISNLKPGQFHIWVGDGSNGKTTFAQIVKNALSTMNPACCSTQEILHRPIEGFGEHRLLITHDWDDTCVIPAQRVQALLDKGFTVIIETNTLPIIRDPTCNLLSATHVIPFKSKFVRHNLYANPAENIFFAETSCFPSNTIMLYLRDKIDNAKNNVQAVRKPKCVSRQMEQLVMLAEHSVDILVGINDEKMKNNSAAAAPKPAVTEPKLVIEEDQEQAEELEEEEYEERHYSPVSIILQHKDKSRPDDTLLIEVDPDSDGFYVTFSQNYLGSEVTSRMTVDDLYDYLLMFFNASKYDEDGYRYAQFNVPLFPSTLVRIGRASVYVSHILSSQIDWLTPDWPSEDVIGPFALNA
jgi:hypothetical protein